MQNGNMDGTRIHAENSVCQESGTTLDTWGCSRIDAVSTRVNTAITIKHVRKSLAGVVATGGQNGARWSWEACSVNRSVSETFNLRISWCSNSNNRWGNEWGYHSVCIYLRTKWLV